VPGRLALLAGVAALTLAGCVTPPADASDTGTCWDNAPRCDRLVEIRANHGAGPLDQDRDLQDYAEHWAEHMAGTGILVHSGGPYSEVVGVGPDWRTVYAAFMDSPEHRAIILDPDYRHVGIGAERSGDRVWLAIVFT
jgi:uncharacterized protein YkwD